MKRTAGNGFWKPTGRDRTIKDKRGSKIGIKKTLVYHEGKVSNGVRTPWDMHEYHITSLPHELTTYVLCQVKYKGEDADIICGDYDSMVSHSNTVNTTCRVPEIEVDQPGLYGLSMDNLFMSMNEQEDLLLMNAFDPNTYLSYNNLNLQQQTPYDEDYYNEFLGYKEALFADQESILQENQDLYRPGEALSSIIVNCNSDSDCSAESISASVKHITHSILSWSDDRYPHLPIF